MSILKKVAASLFVTTIFLCISVGGLFLIDQIIELRVPVSVRGRTVTTSSWAWNNGYVSAQGTWVIDSSSIKGDELPINLSLIECNRKLGYCTQSYVCFFDKILTWDKSVYYIKRWDNNHIVAVDEEEHGHAILTIDRETQEVITHYIKLKDASKEEFLFAFKYDPKRKDRLVDGEKVIEKLKENAFPTLFVWIFSMILMFGYVYSLFKVWKKRGSKMNS